MWQRFTERARRVILLGQEEAGKMNSPHVGTEHLLLGLVRENEGVAAQVLQKMGVSLNKIRQQIEAEVEPGSDPTPPEPKLTPKAKRVLELAADEARRMRHNYIGTEHLLLALLREEKEPAAKVLFEMGLNLKAARQRIRDYVGPDDESEPSAPSNPIHSSKVWLPGAAHKMRAHTSYDFLANPELQAILIAAGNRARTSGHDATHVEHVLLAMLENSTVFAEWVTAAGLSHERAIAYFKQRLQSTLPSAEKLAQQEELIEMHAQKKAAIERDDYEEAARLRDEIIARQEWMLKLETDEPKAD